MTKEEQRQIALEKKISDLGPKIERDSELLKKNKEELATAKKELAALKYEQFSQKLEQLNLDENSALELLKELQSPSSSERVM